MEVTEIQKFYKDKTIFITGSTGLIGKMLVEKLLRSCSEVNRIILTIRPKGKASFEDRVSEYFDDTLFDSIKLNTPNILTKVNFINTNLEDNFCGLNDVDNEFVKTSVNIIFHIAATVSFVSPMKEAISFNIKITKNVIDIAREMKQLQAFIHISTCWVHGYMDYTEEKVINLTHAPEFFLNLLEYNDDELLSKLTPALVKNWPNTYLLTKHVAEYQIEREKDNLPVVIFRAPGVTASYREPFPGWINSIQLSTALGIGLATGIIKVLFSDVQYNSHISPVDFVANCLIAIAWKRAHQNSNEEFKVYNYSNITNPVPRKFFYDLFTKTKYPLEQIVWTPGYVATSNKLLFAIYILLYHTLPATISDTFLKLFGKKPIFKKIIERNNKLISVAGYGLSSNFQFEFINVPALWNTLDPRDQELFNFDINTINWDEYADVFCKSIKLILKEDFDKIDKCEKGRYLLRCKF